MVRIRRLRSNRCRSERRDHVRLRSFPKVYLRAGLPDYEQCEE
jgi:hypothetical protein